VILLARFLGRGRLDGPGQRLPIRQLTIPADFPLYGSLSFISPPRVSITMIPRDQPCAFRSIRQCLVSNQSVFGPSVAFVS
jgi:hypothetical protein